MIYFFQSLSLKTRFVGVLLSFLLVLGCWWLLTGAPWALVHLRLIGHGAGLPDFGFWSPPDALGNLLDQWGSDGRAWYLTALLPASLGFLAAFGLFLALALLYLLKKSNPSARWYLLPVVPLSAALCGFLETAALVVAVVLPPEELDSVAWAVQIFTSARWVLFSVSLAVLCIGLAAALVRKGAGQFRHRSDDDLSNRP